MKLHLGCGKRNFGPDWVHVDGGDYPHIEKKDICNLFCDDRSVETIYCSHVLEYFDREEVVNVLKEWYRVLENGGILRLAVPDFFEMSRLYSQGKFPLKNMLGPLYGKMKMGDSFIFHKTVYDYNDLAEILLSVGFKNVNKYDWRQTEHSMFDDCSQAYLPHMDKENGTLISLNVEAVK